LTSPGCWMFVTSSEQRGGLLVAVVSGGRPTLAERPTARFLSSLHDIGINDIVWVVSEKDAPDYEQDEHPMVVYPKDWAFEYASAHWMLASPPNPGFLGAFPGREWACREAERRGCWGVLQLDDNIIRLAFPRDAQGGRDMAIRHGELALFVDLLTAVTQATNGRMVGANLMSIPSLKLQIARAGFPYSCFIERVGTGRESWYGPYEDDITHAYQYGTRADSASSTAVLVPLLRYKKEPKSKSAMRAYYDHTRAVSLQRIFPESAKIVIKSTTSNGRGNARVYHQMSAKAIRNPMIVKDRELYLTVKSRIEEMLIEWRGLSELAVRAKIKRRAAG
jgi:hypothetical protein